MNGVAMSTSQYSVAVSVLVVDSGALIKTSPLEKWSPYLVTVKEVLTEVRDENARSRLQVLPYELHFKEPSQQAQQHVINFAKKTGDYGSLSAVDVKVMALTYQLACEHQPEKTAEFRVQPARDELLSEKVSLPGIISGVVDSRQPVATLSSCPDDGSCPGDESEGEGWINPDNFADACIEMGGALQEPAVGIVVGCVTTDFAMQNVLLQMGLSVISVDGMQIKQLRTYAKKCKACFKTTTNTALCFCPHCGNKTLAKVSVAVGEDGTLRYHFLSTKQFSHRGLRYSLPQPKGGRHAHNPVLAPDQKITYKAKRSRQPNVNPLHPDYIAQSSPFAMKDVTSRGAQVLFHEKGRVGGRQNPNAVQPKLKRR